MLFFINQLLLLLVDTFVILEIFSLFVCVFIIVMYILFINYNIFLKNINVYLDFIGSKYLDLYWFLIGIFFVIVLLIRLCLLLYYSWISLLIFDLCKIMGFQWYWIFFVFKENVIFSNLLIESDYWIGDLRLLQCNNTFNLICLVVYKIWVTSIDVIHSFTISTLGIKIDCIPGRCNELTIFSNIGGTFYGQCSELCGVLHGFMPVVIEFI
uniref:cytochrome-c oxidase n=1 Tax=Trypanoplasma borreli TaxID=5710 RepID=Q37682_TRYBO|nr:cytochrome oxidase subunit 2 [Trypanoplasma borreli]UYX56960.1 cytochrome oxidase subunit II [Trypanoplasma borreli]